VPLSDGHVIQEANFTGVRVYFNSDCMHHMPLMGSKFLGGCGRRRFGRQRMVVDSYCFQSTHIFGTGREIQAENVSSSGYLCEADLDIRVSFYSTLASRNSNLGPRNESVCGNRNSFSRKMATGSR